MLGGIREKLSASGKKAKLKGSAVVLSRKMLDATDLHAIVVDNIYEIFGNSITCQLISATVTDPNNGGRGMVGSEATLQQWLGLRNLPSLACRGECKFKVKFDWEVEKHGVPGAIIVKNKHSTKFFLKTITLEDVPGRGTVVFVANSWVHPAGKYHGNRVFFANDPYLPSQMPEGLRPYRDDELRCLRGDDKQGPYQAHDRVYRYAVYNDLGEPDRDSGSARPILGGSSEHPYPRRGRTGRVPSRKDPRSESRLSLLEEVYVPSDERFAHLKMADFAGYSLKAIVQGVLPAIRTYVDLSPGEFDSFKDMMNLYTGTLRLPNIPALNELRNSFPIQLVRELLPMGGSYFLKLPKPDIIKENESGWRTDEEFTREILAGVNPVVITRLTEFPPKSSLDPSKYGDHTSTITAHHIEKSLEGLTVQQALDANRLYILDHHDHFMPFLIDINNLVGVHAYATRTLLFLRGDDTLKPLAIELSLPLIKGNLIDATSKVYTPASSGTEYWVWQLAKAYVAVNDSCWHQLISHWLNTHAVMEPFVIATNRQLSVVHPVYKLLHPHYRDTMTINALARQTLVNAGGIFEQVVCFTGKHSLPISSVVYKDWKFTEQGLPDDLIKRGVAVEDQSSPCKVRLLLKDYPYATDGLAIWQAIEEWVTDYCAIYYKDDQAVQADEELRQWWKEVREVGHGDLKDADWWPHMHTVAELTKACTTIVWIASALHAAVNFGQYSYAGYIPNRPTVSRRPMPEPGSEEYAELERKPERFFIRTITSQFQTILGVSLLEILSKHSSDEIYLGQRDTPAWTSDAEALQAFKRFGEKLVQIESGVESRNSDPLLKNRIGPANFPYTLLYPNTSDDEGKATGITAKGIPNSISI